ncbi:MAG: serine/threonine protein kinase [Deltaproteobacteria bacterium]|nr:serine/threonine protein kinase [Deltaproteobacteria bacterium]
MTKKADSLALDPGSPENPAMFGKYLMLGLVAKGGMAEVYRAKRMKEDKMIALKCMRNRLAREQKYVDMFMAEGKLASMLDHPNIVKTYEGGRYRNTCYFTMDYICGKDLNHILRKVQLNGQRIPIPVTLFITSEAAKGLDYAHNLKDEEGKLLNIVNRDVSPSNIRVAYDGDVKLIDFGIAKTKARFTSEIGTLKGKFSYMSPEQIRGLPLDGRTDIFSLGIILYEMLTMERLFKGESETVLMEKVRKSEINPPSSINRRISPELDAVVMKALAREREDRYQTAREFSEDIDRLLEPYKFKPQELSDLMKRIFPDEFQAEMDISRVASTLDFNMNPQDSGRHESFDTIVKKDFNLQEVMELELDIDDSDMDEEVDIKTDNLINQIKEPPVEEPKTADLMKYIYMMIGATVFIIIIIIILLLVKGK